MAVVKQATITRQHLVDALLENLDISLGRRPVKLGPAAIPVEQYVYRGETANNAIKMAGSECGLFQEKTEVTHHMNFDDLSDEQLLIRLRDETEALLLERRAAGLDSGGDEQSNALSNVRPVLAKPAARSPQPAPASTDLLEPWPRRERSGSVQWRGVT